jgi:hypothetical protein
MLIAVPNRVRILVGHDRENVRSPGVRLVQGLRYSRFQWRSDRLLNPVRNRRFVCCLIRQRTTGVSNGTFPF